MKESGFRSQQRINEVLAQLARVVPYDRAAVVLIEGGMVHLFGSAQPRTSLAPLPPEVPLSEAPPLAHLIRTGRPLIIPETADSPLWARGAVVAYGRPEVRSWIGIPLFDDDVAPFGALLLDHCTPGTFGGVQSEMAASFAAHIATLLTNLRLAQALEEQSEVLRLLTETGRDVGRHLDTATPLVHLCRAVAEVLVRRRLVVRLWAGTVRNDRRLVLRATATGGPEVPIEALRVEEASAIPLPEMLGTLHLPLHFPDFSTIPPTDAMRQLMLALGGDAVTSLVVVPLTEGEAPLALLIIGGSPQFEITAIEQELISAVAGQAAVALLNSRVIGQMQSTLSELERAQRLLVERERRAAVSATSATVAHEVNQRLTAIMVAAGLIKRYLGGGTELTTAQAILFARRIETEVRRAGLFIQRLVEISTSSTVPYIAESRLELLDIEEEKKAT